MCVCVCVCVTTGGSVRGLVEEFGVLEEDRIREYVTQVLRALVYLHGRNIVHGDVKCANVLVCDGVVKLADFGCASAGSARATGDVSPSCQSGFKPLVGTVPFMAPEVIRQCGSTSTKADIWSVGCMAVEMGSGCVPWGRFSNTLAAMYYISSKACVPTLPVGASAGYTAFVMRCLIRDPACRPSAADLLQDPWLTGTASSQ